MDYLGHLSQDDPLYSYLRYDILPQAGVSGAVPDFRVYRIRASNHVYLYRDRRTNTRLIGKFFGGAPERSTESSFQRMEREFQNLQHLRDLGFAGYPHYIARPLGRNSFLNCLLVEEYCYGTSLNDVTYEAISFVWQGHMLDLLGRRNEAVAAYSTAVGLNVTDPDPIHHDQFGLAYIPSEYARERMQEPFTRVENPIR